MSSFSFPHRTVLHSTIEEQWFDRPTKETQSSLTAIELAEEAYAQRLASITTPEIPPVVIGKAQHQRFQQVQAQAELQQHQQLSHNPTQRSRRSPVTARRTSSDTMDAHSTTSSSRVAYYHGTESTDDVSTVVNPNRSRNPTSSAVSMTPQSTMFWNRSRRSSAGGDR